MSVWSLQQYLKGIALWVASGYIGIIAITTVVIHISWNQTVRLHQQLIGGPFFPTFCRFPELFRFSDLCRAIGGCKNGKYSQL